MAPSPGDVLRLLRIHTAAATASVPALTAFICGGGPVTVALVFIAGLAHHGWGFSLNEIMDLNVDRRADHLSGKPLVSGRIELHLAWAISVSCLAIAFASILGAAMISGGSVPLVIGLLAASTACGTIYDVWSKKIPFLDLFVGAWFGLLILSAGAAAGIPSDLTGIVLLIAASYSLHLIFNNMVEGGIKDAGTDRASGVRSAAVTMGVRVKGNSISIPRPFMALALSLRGLPIISLMILACLSYFRGAHEALLIVMSTGTIVLFAHSLVFIRSRVRMERKKLLGTFSVHEIGSYALSITALSYTAGIPASIAALLIPVTWFAIFNRIMYRRNLAPKV